MSDHTTSQWRVKVSGGTQVGVRPGESLEIGRKPLRPLPDTGVARLEVEDSAKSMSKRHALLTVTAEGDALLRDLNSTNGSYVVNPDGELMRLPAGRDFPLPTSPIRLQFGDVPVDFVRVDKPEPAVKPFTPHVPNLFDYSSPTATHQEPDAADMSVADILDLRAGEPTAVFDAQSARPAAPLTPLKSLAGVGPEHDEPVQHAPSDASSSSASDDEPASDFHIDIDFPTIASGPVIAPASGDGDASDAGMPPRPRPRAASRPPPRPRRLPCPIRTTTMPPIRCRCGWATHTADPRPAISSPMPAAWNMPWNSLRMLRRPSPRRTIRCRWRIRWQARWSIRW
ncbi:FHA domain-containing protein [Bifidobacterium sp. UTCIF-38]|uniref:FHA domain-containing protein n=1 Tax=Bifidobacterium sp. UTCIF-38 TaxID=1465260 RepID=UPI0035BF33EB